MALHCLFLLGTDWILGQNGNKGQGPMAADSIPKSGHEGCSGGLRKPSGGVTEPRRWAFRISRHADGTALNWSARWRKVPERGTAKLRLCRTQCRPTTRERASMKGHDIHRAAMSDLTRWTAAVIQHEYSMTVPSSRAVGGRAEQGTPSSGTATVPGTGYGRADGTRYKSPELCRSGRKMPHRLPLFRGPRRRRPAAGSGLHCLKTSCCRG